jgi:hypothetical protein
MSGVFRNIDPPPLTARRVCTPRLWWGEDTLAEWRGGGGSIVRKRPDTALYSIYASTLCFFRLDKGLKRSNKEADVVFVFSTFMGVLSVDSLLDC